MKLSTGKRSYPGAKQVYRRTEDGAHRGDTIGTRGEDHPGKPLLRPFVEDGAVVADVPSLDEVRERARRERRRLPAGVRAVRDPDPYPVDVSDALAALAEETAAAIRERHGPA